METPTACTSSGVLAAVERDQSTCCDEETPHDVNTPHLPTPTALYKDGAVPPMAGVTVAVGRGTTLVTETQTD